MTCRLGINTTAFAITLRKISPLLESPGGIYPRAVSFSSRPGIRKPWWTGSGFCRWGNNPPLTTSAYFDNSWDVRVLRNFPVLGSCPLQPCQRHLGAKGWTGSPEDHRGDMLEIRGTVFRITSVSLLKGPRVCRRMGTSRTWKSPGVIEVCTLESVGGHLRIVLNPLQFIMDLVSLLKLAVWIKHTHTYIYTVFSCIL